MNKKIKICGMVIINILLLSILSGCSDSTNSNISTSNASNTTSSQTESSSQNQFTVLEHHAEQDAAGYITIKGKIKNNTQKNFGYVQVEINLYDNQDNQVGSTLANINNFGANSSWTFEAPSFCNNASKYKIMSINGF